MTSTGGISVTYDMAEIERLLLSSQELKGFPQGAAISPLLSILLLITPNTHKLPAGSHILMYADDGLIYSDTPFDEKEIERFFQGFGIKLSAPKSHWVRKDGV